MTDRSLSSDVFAVLSNAVRRDILVHIGNAKMATFTELMRACNLDIMWDCGTLGYHLNRLVGEGIIKRSEEGYALTDFGNHILNLLETVKRMEVNKEMNHRTIMTLGYGSSIGFHCGGTIAKHVEKGDRAYAVVLFDTPPGAARTDMMEAAKKHIGFTDVVSLADSAPELKGIGESVPFLENTLVPPLIPVLLKLKPNIIITFNPGKSVTPYFTEVIGRALHRALNHIVSPFIWSDHLEEFPSIYYFEGWGNYVVDISRFLKKKREYAATLYYRYKNSHYQDVKTLEDAKKKAKELEPYEVFTIGTQIPVSPERREKYEYLR